MNKTQKSALFHLVIMLLWLAALAYIAIELFVLKKMPQGFVAWGLLVALFAAMFSFLVWIRKRQSPREVNADERDKLITNRAAMAAFVSAWIVLPAVSVIPRFILGEEGCIPAWSLPLINFGVLLIVMMVYSAAILIQYFYGSGDGNE
ncbi:MAG: hypothetical protein ACETVZ_05780 [Phycisphaerae bacterium]